MLSCFPAGVHCSMQPGHLIGSRASESYGNQRIDRPRCGKKLHAEHPVCMVSINTRVSSEPLGNYLLLQYSCYLHAPTDIHHVISCGCHNVFCPCSPFYDILLVLVLTCPHPVGKAASASKPTGTHELSMRLYALCILLRVASSPAVLAPSKPAYVSPLNRPPVCVALQGFEDLLLLAGGPLLLLLLHPVAPDNALVQYAVPYIAGS